MSLTKFSRKTAAIFAAGALALAGCSSVDNDLPESKKATGQEASSQDEEMSPQERLHTESGVVIEPGIASCEFNNELEDHMGDGGGVSAFPELDRAELREEEDAYVVTFTGDFFDPEVLLVPGSNVSLQVILSGEDFTAVSPTLMTEFRNGELDVTGTFMDQDFHEQDTAFTLEDGEFTATYAKDSPHFEDFEVDMWTPDVYFDDGDETTNPVSYRCGDGRSWDWEPLS
ncbi:MAG TPA: hypothetical protein VK030_03225 [Actinomycetales bacterium]|nr:hypothetical protein [Actinomycetales bacterium]